MSDTPRTDAHARAGERYRDWATHARQLERELAEAKGDRDFSTDEAYRVTKILDELWSKLAQAKAAGEALAGELRLSQIALEVVCESDRKNLAAQCCVKRSRAALAQWEALKA